MADLQAARPMSKETMTSWLNTMDSYLAQAQNALTLEERAQKLEAATNVGAMLTSRLRVEALLLRIRVESMVK